MTRDEFDAQMWDLLREEDTAQYIADDGLHNGMQVYGKEEVRKIGFGVSASMGLFELAQQEGCDAIVVHHGLNVPKKNMGRVIHDRFAFLMQQGISLWSAHYTLDAHSTLGNNAQIMDIIGATGKERYFDTIGDSNAPWGFVGELPAGTSFASIKAAVEPHFSPMSMYYDFGPQEIRKVVAISGAGIPDLDLLQDLQNNDVDLYITGVPIESTREFVREFGINMIGGGHYHTETLGPKALRAYIDEHWDVETVWLDLENPL